MSKNNGTPKPSFFSFRLRACPQCSGIPTIERKDNLAAFVCPEGSKCREAPVMILFDPGQTAAAVRWWNDRAPVPLPDEIEELMKVVAQHARENKYSDDAQIKLSATMMEKLRAEIFKRIPPEGGHLS